VSDTVICLAADTGAVNEDDESRPPICPRCGVTMVPAALSADDEHEAEWVCLECEELGEDG
jgi:hypothetical protein